MVTATQLPGDPSRTRVIVGMSGGVDSSVAAWLLQEQGFEVEGLFMFNWDADDAYCTAAEDFQDARRVCEELEIPLHRASFAKHYRERVFSHFLAEYRAGRTPNPDILCNREIKFDVFLEHARRLGADYIATGHYARLRRLDDGSVALLTGRDPGKDQSYFLHAVAQSALRQTLFPLGELHKQEVRRLAVEAGFHNHAKKDSTGICFIGEQDFTRFLGRYLATEPGPMVTPEGQEIGRHQGLAFYTLGQRKGLGIGGLAGADERPWYVLDKDMTTNTLYVGQGHDHHWLLHEQLDSSPVAWVSGKPPKLPYGCSARVRYRQQSRPCHIEALGGGRCRVIFDQAQWAITPGQSVVFYQDEHCLGGGVIEARHHGRQTRASA